MLLCTCLFETGVQLATRSSSVHCSSAMAWLISLVTSVASSASTGFCVSTTTLASMRQGLLL